MSWFMGWFTNYLCTFVLIAASPSVFVYFCLHTSAKPSWAIHEWFANVREPVLQMFANVVQGFFAKYHTTNTM